MRSFSIGLILALVGQSHTFAVDPIASPPAPNINLYACPVPPGLEAEQDRRMEAYLNDTNAALGDDGWYATVPAATEVGYSATYPVLLDLSSTPILIGILWGGPGYGDIIDRPMVCGHSMEPHGWNVLVQAYGDGFATIDVRKAIADQPLPTEEGLHEIAPYSFNFDIADIPYQYVQTSVAVGLTKVWRPDLVELGAAFSELPERHPDSSDPDAIWPVLDSFTGVLLTAELPFNRTRAVPTSTVRIAKAMKSALIGGNGVDFDSGLRKQPVNLTGTPYYHGRFSGVEEAHPGEPDPAAEFTFIPEGEELLVQRKGGETVRISLSGWLDQQAADIFVDGTIPRVAISAPSFEFEYQGAKLRYVLIGLVSELVEGQEGYARYKVHRIIGDLFADQPLF
ncbi:hypothetical protein [Devosia aquimaris]|uniref:hypothetical protein n=1 Tax=Devosia aquimaris TaxID=2866214 RepID=UPI001CD12BE5|nr:hypothetical protein [Devosia sp. CJK-A8-3]